MFNFQFNFHIPTPSAEAAGAEWCGTHGVEDVRVARGGCPVREAQAAAGQRGPSLNAPRWLQIFKNFKVKV